jgi:hypothetical protein
MMLLMAIPSISQEVSRQTRNSIDPDPKLSVPIFYDSALSAQGFLSPLVKLRIGRQEALFIIDTGASVNTLADWLAEVARLPNEASNSTTKGSGGREVPFRVAHHVTARMNNGESITLQEAIVVSFPPIFKSLHIGGLLSPQLLPPIGMTAVLDLRKPSLRFLPLAKDAPQLQLASSPSSDTKACRNPASPFMNRLYLAVVSIAGLTDFLLVDTGATATLLSENSALTRALDDQMAAQGDPRIEGATRSEGVGGIVDATRLVPNVEVLRGGSIVVLNPSIGNLGSSCGETGILGMDGLRDCSLVLGDTLLSLSCDGKGL